MHPYERFGKKLTEFRLAAGIEHQAQFAEEVRFSQQTVSRWESGQSRPRQGQIPALAKVLGVDADELSRLAGHGVSPVVATFDQPLPVDALGPESFERFCDSLLRALYRGAQVNRFGSRGHGQTGIDIEVVLNDGSRIDFQCKRVEEFGPASVHDAVKAYGRNADKRIILLSRVASPKARNAVAQCPAWSIWDKEDISAEIRRLPKTEQIRLVDIFFRGQRLALLGETEPNVWQTAAQFYAPFSHSEAFTHDWHLIGRNVEIAELVEALTSNSVALVLLTGVAGGGKSRILKQAIEVFEQNVGSAVLTRFLSPTDGVTSRSLEDLGDGAKLLIVDDAHDRQDLAGLFRFIANRSNNAKLLLAVRPYGLAMIKQQAASFSLFDQRVVEVELKRLSLEQTTELATQVLSALGGHTGAARSIARHTLECPLITVMGAWVVAKEDRYFEFAANEANFRNRVMSTFRKIILGQVSPRDADAVRKFLAVIALLQPFNIENPVFLQICSAIEGLSDVEAPRLFRELVNAGVLYRRGDYYHLAPDLLADFIIEAECIDQDGGSSGYAEKVFGAAEAHSDWDGRFIKQIVLNLGRLDWRRANGDPVNSALLDRIWSKLTPTEKYGDPRLEAVKAVAYYQPARAVSFAEDLFRRGAYIDELPAILKSVSYSVNYLKRACECLWGLGKVDSRETVAPTHPIRILADLASVENSKPLAFNEMVVDFAVSLFGDPGNWQGTYSPLDILRGAIRTEGDTVSFSGPNMSLSPYYVRPNFVRELRAKIRDAAIHLLSNEDVSVAIRAAAFFRSMLTYPMGILGSVIPTEVRALWTAEFVGILEALLAECQNGHLNRLVMFEIARSVTWHAQNPMIGTGEVAKAIVGSRPKDLSLRLVFALVDPHGQIFEKSRIVAVADWTKEAKLVAKALVDAYPDGEALRIKIAEHLKEIRQAKMNAEPHVLVRELLQRSEGFSQSIVETALRDPDSPVAPFVAFALDTLFQKDSASALSLCSALIATGDARLAGAVAVSHGWLDFAKDIYGKHLALVRTLSESENIGVVDATVGALGQIASTDRLAALNIIIGLDFDRFLQAKNEKDLRAAEHLVDQVYNLFHADRGIPFSTLTDDDVGALLDKLLRIRSLDGYWIQTFLADASEFHSMRCAQFLRSRIEIAAVTKDWKYRPCYLDYAHVPLRFRLAPDFPVVLGGTFHWIKSHPDPVFEGNASKLFSAMAQPFDQTVVNLLEGWIPNSDARSIEIMGGFLREADHAFVLTNPQFVSRFLSAARGFGSEALKNATKDLYSASMLGHRSGRAGQPFQRDLDSKREAEIRMQQVSRLSPEYELYRMVRDGALREIKSSAKRAELHADTSED